MTWTNVLGPGGTGMLNDSTSASPSFTPSAVGDMIFLSAGNVSNNTVTATAASSSNATWSFVASHADSTGNGTTDSLFIGTVTSATAATITITWSGTAPANVRITTAEFNSSVSAWTVDVTGFTDSAGTSTWASLTPTGTGELYVGWCADKVTATAGSTTGYTYFVTAHSNGFAYNLNVSAASAPVWGDSNMINGVMMLVKSAVGDSDASNAAVEGAPVTIHVDDGVGFP